MRLQEGAEAVRTSLQPHCGELTDRLLSRRSRDSAALQNPLSAQPGLPLLPLARPAFTGKLQCSAEALSDCCCTYRGLPAQRPFVSAAALAISAQSC